MKPRCFYESIATLTGCVIGAGILGIPYVVAQAGFWTGVMNILVIGLAVLLLHLCVGEVALRTKAPHQLVGYAEKYLGSKGKWLMALSMMIGIYGAMIAYTLGVGESLSQLFGLPFWLAATIFYVLGSLLVFGGLKVLEHSELLMESTKFLVFVVVLAVVFFSQRFHPENLQGFSLARLFMPYGVVLFAYLGTAAIPEVREELKTCALLTRRAIIWGSVIPVIVYLLFTIAVIGVTGGQTTELGTLGLAQAFGSFMAVLLHVFAVLAMATSFIALGYALKQMWIEDFSLPNTESWALTVVVPLSLLALGARSFISALELAGAFSGGLAGILILLMHRIAQSKGNRKPEYQMKIPALLRGALILFFLLGAITVVSVVW